MYVSFLVNTSKYAELYQSRAFKTMCDEIEKSTMEPISKLPLTDGQEVDNYDATTELNIDMGVTKL